MRIETNQDESSIIDLTPMIDVVFLLLIFFMVTTTFLNQEKEMDIDLPQTEGGDPEETQDDEFVINIFEDGRLTLGGVEVKTDELRRSLENAANKNSETPITIRADKRVEHGRTVEVMDVCSVAGLRNLSIGTMESQ